jgi:hypothetical protein
MKSYLKTYITALVAIILAVGLINMTVDPLWYGSGNRLTGINPPLNERVSKTNLFLQKQHEQFDCFLFGTSRVTLFNEPTLQQNHCFNYSFSAGQVEEFVNYAKYIKRKGANPTTIYVGVEPSSFNAAEAPQPPSYPDVTDPLPEYQAYLFSMGSLEMSLRALIEKYTSPRYYDRNFQGKVAEIAPQYKPFFSDDEKSEGCDVSKVEVYRQLRNVFPDARYVGFVPPVSGWYLYNTRYAPGLVDCQLAAIYQVADFFDAVYDFSVPSAQTRRLDNTYDGSHYYPEVYSAIANVLEGRASDFGVKIGDYKLDDYQQLYAARIKGFLATVGEESRWQS